LPAEIRDGMTLRCPDPSGCPVTFEVSTVDPDATLSEIVSHLTGHPHYHRNAMAMRLLACVEETTNP
jgi:hypothetical protein